MSNYSDVLSDEYNISLEVFEGPLDLLLYLIKKEEIDIHDIPIERITDQYLEYLNLMNILDLNIAGDFIVMSATLMLIKSRMLLPKEDQLEQEDDEDDPRWDLVRQLVEYKKFKDAADHLEYLEEKMENIFVREDAFMDLGQAPNVDLADASIFDLITCFNEALGRAGEEDLKEIFAEEYTVSQKITFIIESLKITKQLSITDLFSGMISRQEIVCTFLAVLELMKLSKISAIQDESFGSIVVNSQNSNTISQKELTDEV